MKYGIIQQFDQIVALLIKFINTAFNAGQIGVAYVWTASDVFLMPESKILLMLPTYDFQKAFVLIIYLLFMPLLNGRGMQLGNFSNVDHG